LIYNNEYTILKCRHRETHA